MQIRITPAMWLALIINLLYAKAIGLTQGIMARETGGDIWLDSILSMLQGLFIMFVTIAVVRRVPNKDLTEQATLLLGKWFGFLISLLQFVFFVGAFSATMITLVYHLMDYFLPQLPIYIFVLIALFVTMHGLFHGLEVTARMAIVGVFAIAALNILLLMGSMQFFNIRELLPVFQSGFFHAAYASRHLDTDWAMATMMATMILPLVNDSKQWYWSGIGGVLYGAVFVLMWPILEDGVLSPQETGHYIVACMQMARSAEIGPFLHRYEMMMVACFAISLFVQLMACALCACLAVSHLLQMKEYRPTIVPITLLMGAISYWVVLDHNRAMNLLTHTWPQIALPITFGVPLVVGVMGLILQRKLREQTHLVDP